jgi:hypothetical protein
VVHRTPQRIRVKIPQWQRQDDNFAGLQRALERRPDVVYVRVNALAASIVIHCRDGFEIASVRDCFVGFELVLPPSRSVAWARQIVPAVQGVRDSRSSIRPIGFIVRLLIAIVTRQFEDLLRELILEAAVRLLAQRLHRQLTASLRLAMPRALPAAAAAREPRGRAEAPRV